MIFKTTKEILNNNILLGIESLEEKMRLLYSIDRLDNLDSEIIHKVNKKFNNLKELLSGSPEFNLFFGDASLWLKEMIDYFTALSERVVYNGDYIIKEECDEMLSILTNFKEYISSGRISNSDITRFKDIIYIVNKEE